MKNHVLKIESSRKYGEIGSCFKQEEDNGLILENFPKSINNHPYISDESKKSLASQLQKLKSSNIDINFEFEVPFDAQIEEKRWFKAACEVCCDDSGKPVKAIGYYVDITGQKNEQVKNQEDKKTLELLKKEALYDFKVNLSMDIVSTDEDRDRLQRETGCCEEQRYSYIMNCIANNRVLPEYRKDFLAFTCREQMLSRKQDGCQMESLDYQRLYKGSVQWIRMVVHYVEFENISDVFAYFFVMNINAQKKQELKLTKMAETDALTGLYNRQTAIPKIKRYLKENPSEPAALMMFDMDNFKVANDVFGHAYGDDIIKRSAEKLSNFFRENDIVCRIGGDEFMVLCKNIKDLDIEKRLELIIGEMSTTFGTEEQDIYFSVSAGYAMVPEHGQEFDELYQKADIALFTAKMGGKSSYRKYDTMMKEIRYELARKE